MRRIFELINKNLFSSVRAFRAKPLLPSQKKPLITISREKGSGGRPIAYQVAAKLGKPWKVYHKEIVEEIAKQTHLEKELIAQVDEAKTSAIEEIIDDFFGKRYLSFSSYYKHLLKMLSAIGSQGHAIIVGRGANFLFPNSLKIRIICSKKQRIKWLIDYEKLTKEQAVKRIAEFDKKRFDFGESLFSHDIRKAHHYDLVIQTGENMPVEVASHIIVCAAKRRFKI